MTDRYRFMTQTATTASPLLSDVALCDFRFFPNLEALSKRAPVKPPDSDNITSIKYLLKASNAYTY
jgi:hypothetical protein